MQVGHLDSDCLCKIRTQTYVSNLCGIIHRFRHDFIHYVFDIHCCYKPRMNWKPTLLAKMRWWNMRCNCVTLSPYANLYNVKLCNVNLQPIQANFSVSDVQGGSILFSPFPVRLFFSFSIVFLDQYLSFSVATRLSPKHVLGNCSENYGKMRKISENLSSNKDLWLKKYGPPCFLSLKIVK